uniref:Uncharacterized protein n=1 Tax=Chromera velia CCMP2878 TaxID=1169474 RepID=A0A0G4F4V4_9ALVE|eukprot:Cvel_15047.t1-p1 / transcript=Cvel_15047.t1 / gene=Cvel_15047 / organism=Chromera_velia_CCMP2878 / gene_product=hypothetical protein / transcript_product=hypothetical protein / location=Cvel_scaffold1096:3011-3895(+) / protein_length=176 / sequence_SO=supercontig / SO=protein_coding / is_pseudo=false
MLRPSSRTGRAATSLSHTLCWVGGPLFRRPFIRAGMRRSLIMPSSCPICPPAPGTTRATNFHSCCRDLEQAAYALCGANSAAVATLFTFLAHSFTFSCIHFSLCASVPTCPPRRRVPSTIYRGGAGGRAEGGYEWREEGEEEEDEEEEEEEEAWREEEKEEEEGEEEEEEEEEGEG